MNLDCLDRRLVDSPEMIPYSVQVLMWPESLIPVTGV